MYSRTTLTHAVILTAVALAGLFAAGCNGGPPPATPVATLPVETPTPAAPTPTPEPMAASVNGEGIPLAEYQAELGRYQTAQEALGKTASPADAGKVVIDDLIDQMLLAQAAAEAGYTASDAAVQSRVDQLAAQMGGADALAQWQDQQGYSNTSFRWMLRLGMAAGWQRDQIAAQVPQAAEQIHARQILLRDADTAQTYLGRLKNGTDFAELARRVDPLTGGDLGWFPRGYLTDPAVEAAAFALPPGQYSDVIQTSAGYLIIQVIEVDAQHPLSPDARLALQRRALQEWLDARRAASQIQILIP